jgi:hypothetical protein
MPPEQTTENTPRWVTIIQASGPATEQRVIVIEQDEFGRMLSITDDIGGIYSIMREFYHA